MKRHRIIQGVSVVTYDGQPTKFGEGVRILLPDGSETTAAPHEDHPTLDSAVAYAVGRWRVARWRESGHGGVI